MVDISERDMKMVRASEKHFPSVGKLSVLIGGIGVALGVTGHVEEANAVMGIDAWMLLITGWFLAANETIRHEYSKYMRK